MGTLFVVSTPIGNLSDLTRRAEEALGEAAVVLAEDTRRTGVLLRHLGVETPLMSLHQHNEAGRTREVLGRLASGAVLALVADAGTPLVSDPGGRLVEAVIAEGHTVVPIPGPSAVLAALVGSGLPADRFAFLGFSPRKGRDREAFLARVADSEETTILFESPERISALLDDLAKRCGRTRRVAVARELTKLHEEFVRGTLIEASRYYRENPPRGEITVVVEAAPESAEGELSDEEAVRVLARSALDRGLRPSAAAREVARRLGAPRNQVYRIVQSLDS